VTNVKTGAAVVVRVNDRGPFLEDRIIDLSYAAATRVGVAAAGTGEVQIERLTNAEIAAGGNRRADPVPPPIAAAPIAVAPSVPPPEAIDAPRPAQHWAVQLGAFAQAPNAEAMRSRVAADLARAGSAQAPRVERIGTLFRVLVGEVADRAQAMQAAQQLERSLNLPTMLVLY
jgi:rare lipoprotein A